MSDEDTEQHPAVATYGNGRFKRVHDLTVLVAALVMLAVEVWKVLTGQAVDRLIILGALALLGYLPVVGKERKA